MSFLKAFLGSILILLMFLVAVLILILGVRHSGNYDMFIGP